MFLRPQWNVPQTEVFSKTTATTVKNNEKTSVLTESQVINNIADSIININNNNNNKSRIGHSKNNNNNSNNNNNNSTPSSGSVNKYSSHAFNTSRLHDDLCDQFGAEEPGAPREW